MLGDVAREASRRFGDTPAFVREGGEQLTYADLDRLSDEVACGLISRGVRERDVIALMTGSGTGYIVAYVAVSKIGALTAGVNERLSAPEQAACLVAARPAFVIADRSRARSGSGSALLETVDMNSAEVLTVDSPAPTDEIFGDLRVIGGTPPELSDDPDRPVAIVFTSGTTGNPKGAVFCGRQLDTIGEVDGGRRFGGGGRGLGSTSMAHLATMTKLPQTIRSGGTTFLMGKWSAGEALEKVERHRITSLGGIPTQIALMLRHDRFDSTDLSSVRIIALGGGPSTPSLIREARERFGVPVVVRYTCTEAGVGTGTAVDDPPEDALESVGRARNGIEVSIRDPQSGLLVASSGREDEVGEVCLRSGAVMTGYFGNPEATAEAFTSDGAVRTGDLGWLDDRGRLHLCGRAKEMYVRGGYNVFPIEVEAVLVEHPSIAHVAVAPRPDHVMGEVGVAVVVLRDGAKAPELGELRHYAEGRLAHHKLPEDLLIVEELPRTAMEKIDRRELQKLIADRADGE